MASPLRQVGTGANSQSLEEARKRVFHFFREACRSIPQIMETYNLHEVITTSQLRSVVAAQFRKQAHVTNPKVIDMLIIKGDEELRNCLDHSKQRHHILGQYVIAQGGLIPSNVGAVSSGGSDFLQKFYNSNNF
uniref:NADH dehydrogenase [ubiquinone] 1 alpha subcomplex subunit 6 n=1 Tax=Picea sitchensis TaxID=3332 RepID=A9P0K9_PICSI|nr:unknown [Picea sitchensis]